MIGFGTDLVALGCILGGAAVGGAATLAMTVGGGHADARCAVEAFAVIPGIAISHGREARTIVVTPKVLVHLDNHFEQFDTQSDQLDQALELQMQQLEFQLEATLGQEMEARIQFEEAMRQVEAARLRVVVEKIEGGGI